MENFQIVNNFLVIYFVNSKSLPIFALTFINKAKHLQRNETFTIKSNIDKSGKANVHLR